MFGFIVANPEKLSENQRARYKSLYCGLCKALGENRSYLDRMTLTYDMVFLILILSSGFSAEENTHSGRCALHPVHSREFIFSEFTSYAADMNIALAYYNFLDDWLDDKSVGALMKARLFKRETEKIAMKYPRQCEKITECLQKLSEAERAGVINPDIPAGIFGELMGEIFRYSDSEEYDKYREFGNALGKFIYIMDASLDISSDIKRGRYNPLMRYTFESSRPVLELLMADCMEKYKKLPVENDRDIIENILYSGVWTRYETDPRRRKKDE